MLPPPRFRLTATTVAGHFKYRCDRRFRWNAVPSGAHGRTGIGWGAHVPQRNEVRPGIQPLMEGGDAFEREHVEALREAYGEAFVWGGLVTETSTQPNGTEKVTTKVGIVPFERFLEILRQPDGVRYVAQPQLGYNERWKDEQGVRHLATPEQQAINGAIEQAFLPAAGLDWSRVSLGLSRPDLVEILPPEPERGFERPRLRVWDFKASRAPQHEHYVQVAWYTFLLDAVLRSHGIDTVEVDHEVGAIRSREQTRDAAGALVDADPLFDLAPYRLAVVDFLRQKASALLDVPADRAHYHVCDVCLTCEHLARCREQADASHDVSRVAYLTSDGKRRLVELGFGSHHDLTGLAVAMESGDERAAEIADSLRRRSHDLKVHLDRHLAAARALEDGREHWLARPSLLLPKSENVRVVLSAERDGVTLRGFAFGLKTYEGWDEAAGKPLGMERAYVSARRGDEGELLFGFLTDLFVLLERVDAENRALDTTAIPEDEAVQAARDDLARLTTARSDLEAAQAALGSARDTATTAERKRIREELHALGGPRSRQIGEATKGLERARRAAEWERKKRKRTLQLYLYDSLDLAILSEAVERHLFDPNTPEGFYRLLRNLARLVPPPTSLADDQTLRSLPFVVVQQALRQHVALPVPYAYDLATVSQRFRGRRADGEDKGIALDLKNFFGFFVESSNQVAFERIHEVWDGKTFSHRTSRAEGVTREGAVIANGEIVYEPEVLRRKIESAVLTKLRATDSVVQHLRREMAAQGLLLFYKDPFRLFDAFDPSLPLDSGPARLIDALRVFTVLEESRKEHDRKTLHTELPTDRAARTEAIAGLSFEGRYSNSLQPDAAGPLYAFTFDEASREARIDAGDLGLVLTDAAAPEQLLYDVDGPLYRSASRPYGYARVSLVRIDARASPPRLWLRPDDPGGLAGKLLGFDGKADPALLPGALTGRTLVLDKSYTDLTSPRVLRTLRRLAEAARDGDASAAHVLALVETGWNRAWQPHLHGAETAYDALARMARAQPGADPDRPLLNDGQRRAFDGAFASPVALVWGPPGTGKSHTLAHILLAQALAARAAGRPLALLVTAFTHHAIGSVLAKTAKLAAAYGIGPDVIQVAKVMSSTGHAADDLLPDSVRRVPKGERANLLSDLEQSAGTWVVGATVWGVDDLAAMRRPAPPAPADGDAPETSGPAVVPLFDGVLVDEASQMKLPDALLAFSTLKPGGSVLLAGDDQQLPPIIQGTYPDITAPFLTSVFAFMRHRMNERRDAGDADAERRTLFLLDENYRMNEPLTRYPREVIYGTFRSLQPDIRIALVDASAEESSETESDTALLEALLDPERPVVFVRYAAPEAFTARNPLEADLAARIVQALSRRLVDPRTGLRYTPEAFAQEGVAVVAPHRAQNAAIRASLADRGFGPREDGRNDRPMPLVDTVDKAQGQEFDVVIVSYGVADETYAEAESAFLLSRNRFNVALTRARRKAIVLVSDVVVEVVPTDRQVLLDAMMLKAFDTYCTDGAAEFVFQTSPSGSEEGRANPLVLRLAWKTFDPVS